MIRRVARVIAALGGAAESETELAAVAEALKKSGVDARRIADTLIGACEELGADARGGIGLWSASTAIGACFAAAGGAMGLRAIASALLPGATFAWIAPLIAVPIAVFALVQAIAAARARRADERERAAVAIGLALTKIGVAARLALEVAVAISALEEERARALIGFDARLLAVRKSGLAIAESGAGSASAPAGGRFYPAAAAVWAIACFWILYFGTVAAGMSQGFGE